MTEKLDCLRILTLAENTAPFGGSLLGQHGLSFLIEGKSEQAILQVIMDVGQDYDALCKNMEKLNINAGQVDAIVLSHCHYDHTSNIVALLTQTKKQGVPVIAHPHIFRTHFINAPVLRHVGMTKGNNMQALVSAGGQLFLTRDPLPLMPGLTTTGEVPRITSFEENVLKVFTINKGNMLKDSMPDDISLVACIKGRGLVVITGCSHAGIINIIKQAFSLYPGEELHAVIGGLHLVGAGAERISKTVEELCSFKPDLVSAGHCTGFDAQVALYNGLGERFVPLSTGAEFIISK